MKTRVRTCTAVGSERERPDRIRRDRRLGTGHDLAVNATGRPQGRDVPGGRFPKTVLGGRVGGLKGEQYRDDVFAYIEKEDTPRPPGYQLGLMTRAGFRDPEVLHKHLCFATFGALKR